MVPVFSTTAVACAWAEFNEVWNSGAATTADLCIRNQNTSIGGNDFAIDDITFREVCVQNDTINVTYDPLTVSIASDLLFCENETETFQASSTVPNTTLIWETGDIGNTYTPTVSGTYTVHAISANGCYVADSAVATITPMPWGIDTIIVGPLPRAVQTMVMFLFSPMVRSMILRCIPGMVRERQIQIRSTLLCGRI